VPLAAASVQPGTALETSAGASTQDEWKPLGVFAVSVEADKSPTQYFQLVVNKNGAIGGVFRNEATLDETPIYGCVDEKSQRAAWHVGEDSKVVYETGIYNLTQPETPALVHYGTERTMKLTLIRVEEPPVTQ